VLDLLKIRKKTGRHKALPHGVESAAPDAVPAPEPAPSPVKAADAARRKPQAASPRDAKAGIAAQKKPAKSAPPVKRSSSIGEDFSEPAPSPPPESAEEKSSAAPAPMANPFALKLSAVLSEPPPPPRSEFRQSKILPAIAPPPAPATPAAAPVAPGALQELQVADDALNRHLLCRVHQETFAVPISDILEILRERSLTPLPLTAPALAGILSLRGRMVPVVDAALRLGFDPFPSDENCRIVVFEIAEEWIGLRVAAVGQVSLIDPETVQHSAAALGETRSEITSGVLRISDQFVTVPLLQQLLDVTSA
jgi:purine-binding chemotaxis protein CheW